MGRIAIPMAVLVSYLANVFGSLSIPDWIVLAVPGLLASGAVLWAWHHEKPGHGDGRTGLWSRGER